LSKIEYGIGILLLGILCVLSIYNYSVFHIFVELFSVIIALGIASLVWHGRRFINNGYYIILGFAYALIGIFDLFHAISYKNMGFFQDSGSNLPTQFWVAARYFESISLFIAPFFITKKNFIPAFIVYSIIFITTLLSILQFKNFPICYVDDGWGLTNFKIFSEYLIISIFLSALAHVFYHKKRYFDKQVLKWFILSIIASIIGEICFTLYVGVFDVVNVIGHYFKFISYYCLYKAFIETSFTRPFNTLFRELQASEALFRTYFDLPLVGRAIITWRDQKWIKVNEKFYELLGYSKEGLNEQTWKSLTHPEDLPLERQKFELIEQNRIDNYSCEKRFIRQDGSVLEAEISLACVRNKQNVPDYFVATVADIGQRKDMEREKEILINELKEAVFNIEVLQTLLPVCPSCYSMKDDQGYWHRVEDYLNEYTPMRVEYTFCDKCLKKYHPELFEARKTVAQCHNYLDKIKIHKLKS